MKGKNTSKIGKREERQIVKDLTERGYAARRQPGSGNRAVDLQHDVLWHDSPAGKLHIEDKYREESRWKVLDGWKAGADILTVRQARGERMAFLSWALLLELIGRAHEPEPVGDEPARPLNPSVQRKIASRPFQKAPAGHKHFQTGRNVGT